MSLGRHSRCFAWSYSSVTEGDQHASCVRKYRSSLIQRHRQPAAVNVASSWQYLALMSPPNIRLLRDIENDAHEDAADGMNGLVPVKPFMHQPVECSGHRRRFS